ncbi:selenoprotein S A-like [Homarus americanus]|nr:selenoprotein S A-like [Homarus americanus]
MGEPEQVIAEPDEVEDVDSNVDGLHPPTLQQQSPWFLSYLITKVIAAIASNGWYALGFLLLGYILWRIVEPKFQLWLKKQKEYQEYAEYHKDPDTVLARERALDEARKRMQEKYNEEAQIKAAKFLEQEEKRRLERIEEWERHKRGEGYWNKNRSGASGTSPAAQGNTSSDKPSGKPRLRPEYNPLSGDGIGETRGWRPQRSLSGGG